jgi:hypothetical protein
MTCWQFHRLLQTCLPASPLRCVPILPHRCHCPGSLQARLICPACACAPFLQRRIALNVSCVRCLSLKRAIDASLMQACDATSKMDSIMLAHAKSDVMICTMASSGLQPVVASTFHLFVSISCKSSPLLGAANSVSSPAWGLAELDSGGALSRKVSAVSWIIFGGAVVAFTAAVATAEGPLAPAKLDLCVFASVLASGDGCCA